MLPTSGAVPVVIKSLIFPTTAAVGQDWQAGTARRRRARGRGGVSFTAVIPGRAKALARHS